MTTDLAQRLQDLASRTASGGGGRTGPVTVGDLSPEVLELIRQTHIVKLELPTPFGVPDLAVQNEHSTIKDFQKMLDDILGGNNIFLVGPAGTGKTFTAEAICKVLYGPVGEYMEVINCSQWTSPRDLIGGETIEGYKEGGLINAWKDGKLLVLDELPKLDPNTAGLLNDALAKTGHRGATAPTLTSAARKVYPKHARFGVVATGNITGKKTSSKYGGNNRQDASLIDRFAGSYYWVDFNRDLERSLVYEPVFSIFDAIRDVLLKEDIENDVTLRVMMNANRTYMLEMARLSGEVNEVPGGKTLRDTVESYLKLQDDDTRSLITKALGTRLTDFYNSYRNVARYQGEKAKRAKSVR